MSADLPPIDTGHLFEPFLRDRQEFTVSIGRDALPGDLVLCDAGGWGDMRRVLARGPGGSLVTGVDACPRAREAVGPESVLGVVSRRGGRGRGSARLVAAAFPAWSVLAAAGAWLLRPAGASGAEPGDWYTSFLTPRGEIGASYIHLFLPGAVVREAGSAGYDRVEAIEAAHFVASGFRFGVRAG